MAEKKKRKPLDAAAGLRQMERLLGGAARGKKKQEQEAQQLVYDAWESPADQAVELLQQALELDPANVDAWLGLLELGGPPPDEQIGLLRRLVAMAQENLGADFNEYKGAFWGFHETRPYMRARGKLAHMLTETGQWEEAAAEYEAMLELNPNDNQGVRYELMTAYLTLERMEGARKLFKTFAGERKHSTIWAWAYVLERRLSGALDEARQALAVARKQNPHAPPYFLGHRKLPKNMPGSYGIGTREEAMIAWEILRPAWEKHPEIIQWLAGECGESQTGPNPADFRIVP
ncbi:MAG TPA: tetratricopeptide repeat protein [Kiritimatiellia bacterium]|nr:tetratricopeptide repeat protein [Kiritimatiellia bacterium]